MLDLHEMKELFEVYLGPLKEDISELKEGQAKLIEIIKVQVKHGELLTYMQVQMEECKNYRTNKNIKLWEIFKLFLAGVLGALSTKIWN